MKAINLLKKPLNLSLLFILFLFIFSLIYDYPSITLKRPQSVHHWRQSDCASLALNYYQTGMNFFKPQTHNLTSDNLTSGYCATSEIPIGYFFVAILYKIFGFHDFIFRLVNTIIFLTGLFFLYRTCFILFKDFFWSCFIPLIFFTSPVIVYYGNNYILDSPALSFSLIAWYYFIRYYQERNQKSFILSMLFFLLAGAFKISALISFVSIGIAFLLELVNIIKFKPEKKLFSNPISSFLYFTIVVLVIGSWVLYAKKYNAIHATGYFSTRILPIWDLNSEQKQSILKTVKELWLNQYFHVYTLYFFAFLFIFNLLFLKKANKFLITINIFLFLGTILYIILWFSTFNHHDYYTLNLYILLIITILNFTWILKSNFPKFFSSIVLKALLFVFLVFNLHHANKQMRERYQGWWNEYPIYKDYHTVTPYLRSIGIAPLDTVICLPDDSHFTLYLMNQRGWTSCLGVIHDSTSIAASIDRGAEYLIVNGTETLEKPYIQSFLSKPIGQFNDIKIFKIR